MGRVYHNQKPVARNRLPEETRDQKPGELQKTTTGHRGLARSAALLGSLTGASRVLGFVRDVLIARFFGTSAAAQAFVVAWRIPNLLRDLVGEGATNSALVPTLTELKNERPADFWRSVGNLFNLLTLLLLLLVILGVWGAPWIVRLIAPGFLDDPEKFRLTVFLTRLLFPYLLLVGWWAFAMGVLNSLKHFFSPALGPCLLNACMIAGMLWMADRIALAVLALVGAILVGGTLQVLADLPVLFRSGFRWRAGIDFKDSVLIKFSKLLGPRMVGSCVYQLSAFVDTLMASFAWIVGEGAVAALYYSNRLVQLPLAIFGVSVAQAVLPTLSEHANAREDAKFRETISFGLRSVFMVCIPATVGLLVLSRPLVRALFERGAFDPYSTGITAAALSFYSLGLFAYAGVKVLSGAFYSMQDTRTPVKIAAGSLALNVILNLFLMWPLKVGGLALATSISSSFNFACLAWLLQKRLGNLAFERVWASSRRMLLASILMGGALRLHLALLEHFWPGLEGTAFLLAILLLVVLGILYYAGFAFLLGVQEVRSVFAWAVRRAPKGSGLGF